MGIVFLYVAYLNRTVNIAIPVFNNFILYLASAILGIYLTLAISQWPGLKIFDFFGKNSLFIFATHSIWIKVYVLIISNIYHSHYEAMVNIPFSLSIIGGIFVMCLSIPTIYIIKPLYNYVYQKISQWIFG